MTASHIPSTSDYLLANGTPDSVALVDAGERYTYGQLRGAASTLAARLAALDLPPGSRVGVLGPGSLFWVAAYLAVMKLGHVAVPFSDKLTPDDIRRDAALVGCAAVFADRRVWPGFAPAFGAGVAVLTDEPGWEHDCERGREPRWPDSVPVDPGADAALMFTSGSTSRPKAVRVTHGNIQANTESIIDFLGLRADDRVLAILPFHYCYGASLLHTHLRRGGRVVLCRSFVFPQIALDLLEREECTVLAGVPSSFQLLLRASAFARRALPSLRLIQAAGGKLPPAAIKELLAAKPAAKLFVMYGQTEATARLSYLPPDKLRAKPGSIGNGIPGVQLRVLNNSGAPVAPGERGEIYATGANISPGYYDDPRGSAAKFTRHGLRTGDLATVDDDGDIFIVGRRDDFIKSWGHRVCSQEVEAAALRMEQLVSAAVIGVPDDEAGEAVTLFAAARPGAGVTPDDVLAVCRQHLPKYMVPASVLILDALPLNANGKIAKPRLREMALASTPCLEELRRAWRSRDRHRGGGPHRGADKRQRTDVPDPVVHRQGDRLLPRQGGAKPSLRGAVRRQGGRDQGAAGRLGRAAALAVHRDHQRPARRRVGQPVRRHPGRRDQGRGGRNRGVARALRRVRHRDRLRRRHERHERQKRHERHKRHHQ